MKYSGIFRSSILLFAFTCCSEKDPENPTPEPEEQETPATAPVDCDFVFDEADLAAKGWTKTFEENFDNDLSNWNIWVGGAFNNELQHYQFGNLTLNDGVLHISAKRETVTGATDPWNSSTKTFNFTSGRIESKTTVSASTATPKVRMVARVKLASGKGMWPAFWSYGDPWPTQGEIDIIEARGHEPTKYQTNYFYGTSAGNNLVKGAEKMITANGDLTTCFHTYEMIWEKDKLTSILDGNIVEVKTRGNYIAQMFGKEQRITLNLAVGGLFFQNLDPSTIEPGVFEVDWVKVFTSN